MESLEQYDEYLKARLSQKRYIHSKNVSEASVMLAKKFGGTDVETARFAGLVHDICKEEPEDVQYTLMMQSSMDVCMEERKAFKVWHGIAGAELLLETSTDGKNWTEVSKITTDKTGIAKWDDLKIGAQYRVTEVKAPAGYTLMAEPLFTGVLDNTNPDVTITACNSAGFVLPFTGGVGFTTYFMFAALMLCMGVYFCKKSYMKKEN